jgi:hypothetical protein
VLGRHVDHIEGSVRSRSDQASGSAEASTALAERVASLSASATGAERAIRVTVASSGAVTGLELDDRVQRLTGAELAAEILRAMRRAQAGLVEQAAVAVEETVGTDSETGRAVLESFGRRFPAEPAEVTTPVMPSPPPFPSFPNLPHQSAGGGRGSRGH